MIAVTGVSSRDVFFAGVLARVAIVIFGILVPVSLGSGIAIARLLLGTVNRERGGEAVVIAGRTRREGPECAAATDALYFAAFFAVFF